MLQAFCLVGVRRRCLIQLLCELPRHEITPCCVLLEAHPGHVLPCLDPVLNPVAAGTAGAIPRVSVEEGGALAFVPRTPPGQAVSRGVPRSLQSGSVALGVPALREGGYSDAPDVYEDGLAVVIPKWQKWAPAGKRKLEQATLECKVALPCTTKSLHIENSRYF